MGTLYQTLGLPQGASEQQVKAAFRTLARQFHPDVNDGDKLAEQRFKDVSRAYETLADPGTRAAYDRALVCRREETRRRYFSLATIASATFALTASTGALAVWLSGHARLPQPMQEQSALASSADARAPQAGQPGETAKSSSWGETAVDASLQERRRGWSWTTYQNARFGFALKYPADVFAFDSGTGNENVRTLVSRDGGALLRVFAAENSTGTTPAKYRRSLIETQYAGAVLHYTPLRKSWFVLSGTRGDKAFYERVTFSCDGKSMHGWQMIYPVSERTVYDLVVDEIHRNYAHAARSGERCGMARPKPAHSRKVSDDRRG